jgi:hypothetical protein
MFKVCMNTFRHAVSVMPEINAKINQSINNGTNYSSMELWTK